MNSNHRKITYLKDYLPPDFHIDEVFLDFDLHEYETIVKSELHFRRNPDSKDLNSPLILNGLSLELLSVVLNEKRLSAFQYQLEDEHLILPEVPDKFVLKIEVRILPQKNHHFNGLYKSKGNFCTQNEPNGFRYITYFLDRPDVMSRFVTSITADQGLYPCLLSNGNLIESKVLSDGRHTVVWKDPSLKSCYLFALVAGDFDVLTEKFETMSGRSVDLYLYLEKGFSDQGSYALEALKRAMRWDETRWGREYDLDVYMIVAVSDFNMGAMENKGLNIFNTKYILAKKEVATDEDYFHIEAVIGHEYFHNWSGNRVTCRDWFQITLKEGLTVFREQAFSADMTSQAFARIPEVKVMRSNQFSEDAGPLSHPICPENYIEINNFYTLTIYRKGAEVIRMVETLIGPKTFRKALDLYFKRHDGQAVTTEDFIQVMQEVSGKNFTHFKQWYSQAGTPRLAIDGKYDTDEKTFTLTIEQADSPLNMPIAIGLIGSSCFDMPTQLFGEDKVQSGTRILEITKKSSTFTFINVLESPTPSLLRNFSAPVIYDYPYTNDELALLMRYDTDAFSRWHAAQSLWSHFIMSVISTYQKELRLSISDFFIDTFRSILAPMRGDLSLLANLITLPSKQYLLCQLKSESTNVDSIHAAYDFVEPELSQALFEDLLKAYQHCQLKNPYQHDIESVGRRSLKNVCLHYLVLTNRPEMIDLAVQQYKSSDNMTDRMGALQALNNYVGPEREELLDSFYEEWHSEPSVVNKWLSLQASSSLPGTLKTVKSLLDHPAFIIENPNNVYALLCSFGSNLVSFHDISGQGYLFIADQVLALDAKNPQVAARVLQPLTQWRQMDKPRQKLICNELDRIASTSGISPDVYELSNKSR